MLSEEVVQAIGQIDHQFEFNNKMVFVRKGASIMVYLICTISLIGGFGDHGYE